MIGLQKYILDNNIKVVWLSNEIGVSPQAIWRWFNVNKIPENHLNILAEKLAIDKEYLNTCVNTINKKQKKKKGFNDYKINGDITVIYMIKKNGEVIETIIDTEDLERIKELNFSWHVKWEPSTRSYYATAIEYYKPPEGKNKKQRILYLHNIVMNSDGTQIVDHKDNNTLDNRKCNLRYVEKKQNLWNRKGANKNSSTGVRNVNWMKRYNQYWVQIMKDGVRYKWEFPLSQFDEACEFAIMKRKELFGEYAGNS